MASEDNDSPLKRTDDLSGLSPAERAKIYKERAAARGIGKAPGEGGQAPTPPAEPAKPPAAEKPAPADKPAAASSGGGAGASGPLGKTGDLSGLSPAERARIYKERAAAAGLGRPPSQEAGAGAAPADKPPTPERPAAAAGSGPKAGAGAAGLTPDQRQRLAAAVQRGAAGGAAAGTATAAPAAAASAKPSAVEAQQQRLVYVWPHLVTIEFLAAVLSMLSMFIIAYVIQSPLEAHANPDRTPNPSKAPWYFLNLQELLLHMHPALAGVIVPSAALALIAIIPYFDRDTRDVGKWFGTPKSVPIFWFTTAYSTVVLTLLIFFDEYVGVKPLMTRLAQDSGVTLLASDVMVNIIVPLILMFAPMAVLFWLIQRIYKPDSVRDWMVCLFTGFLIVYIHLTIIGTFFRGQGMHLYWPWDPRMIRLE